MRFWTRPAALGAALAMTAAPGIAQAQFPDRPVEVTVTFAAGGMPDILARALSEGMAAALKQPVVIVNRLGAAGAIGGTTVSRAEANGYSLLFAPALIRSVVPVLQPNVAYRPESLVPICQTFESQMALIVRPQSPFQSVKDILDAAAAKPGTLSYGHAGNGSIPHLTMMELQDRTGANVIAIPFKGDSDVVPQLLGGHVDFAPMTLGSVPRDSVRILGIFAEARNPGLPNVPTVKEQGYDVTPTSFGGLYAPVGLPADVTQKLVEACRKGTETETYRKAAERALLGKDLFAGPETFNARLLRDEQDKRRVLQKLGYPK